ncbi:MAG: hypothetical protein PHU91_04590 [Candidatus Omnitrophica bacterium]|nr:hypothetical protein [Candidatus Omnitrophota bacterium]MDD5236919.1 hypothetical protein [Candidatus Omnitrophota bacterium]MDD5610015.1 hypothetical protein [Candidatus Omnitrophota bacterium]
MEKYLRLLPAELKEVISYAQNISGQLEYRAYLVGGFVRDLILDVPNLDMDIVVEGDGLKFAEALCNCMDGKLTKHRRFGTATVILPNKIKIDVATARKETYAHPAALPVVSPGDIRDDLARRDFTINAMAINISSAGFGNFIDFFHGKDDLLLKRIRILHDLSFIDDPTRILRAIRFEQRYGLKIEPHTYSLLRQALKKGVLEKVDKQRIRDEMILTLKEREPVKYIKRISKLIGLSFFSPKLRPAQAKFLYLAKAKKEIAWFKKSFPKKRMLDAWLIYLMAMLKDADRAELLSLCRKFAFRMGETKRIQSYAHAFNKADTLLAKKDIAPSKVYQLLEPLSYEVIILIRALTRKKEVKMNIEDFFRVYNGTRIHVNGDDLKSLGIKPGPAFKNILIKLLYAKIDYQFKSKEEELAFVRTLSIKKWS